MEEIVARKRRKRKKATTPQPPQAEPTKRAQKRKPRATGKRKQQIKHIKGSPERIARRLMIELMPKLTKDKNGKSGFETSRYNMKRFILSSLKEDGKPRDPSSVAKLMPIYSARTQSGYRKVWKSFFTHIRENHGVNDVTKVKRWHVEEFMKDIIDRDVALRTYKTYSAAMSKLEVAVNKVRAYPVLFDATLKKLNRDAKSNLTMNDPLRAYVDPTASIARILNNTHQLAALLQLEGGARIAEISELTAERNLRGIRNGVGRIRLTNTKGGRIRIMNVSAETYKRVRDIIKADGKFEFVRHYYSREAGAAFRSRGEKWNGSHGLRWNFAQQRFYELQTEENKTFNEALKLVSLELGHSRPSITLHYLR